MWVIYPQYIADRGNKLSIRVAIFQTFKFLQNNFNIYPFFAKQINIYPQYIADRGNKISIRVVIFKTLKFLQKTFNLYPFLQQKNFQFIADRGNKLSIRVAIFQTFKFFAAAKNPVPLSMQNIPFHCPQFNAMTFGGRAWSKLANRVLT